MAKITLAVKYRPTCFEDAVEQDSIKRILGHQIDTNSTKNSYLFCGPAGCGKTTFARIFAKKINKEQGNPIEIDAASNNSVDNVRVIIDEAKMKSLDTEYKVYIIDECHMLSNGAWNALLKLLEEPPLKTIFILCTTDPQKIPATILSRVQRFDFKRISFNNVVKRLLYICNQEAKEDTEITWTEEAIEYIARIADGGMRDAITLLDKCLSYTKSLDAITAVKALDMLDYEITFNLYRALINKNIEEVVTITENIYSNGVDIKLFCKQLLQFVLNANKYFLTKEAKYTNLPISILEKLNTINTQNIELLLALTDWLVKLNELIKWEVSPKTLFQANLLSWCR